jgi:hypothetical protein
MDVDSEKHFIAAALKLCRSVVAKEMAVDAATDQLRALLVCQLNFLTEFASKPSALF